MENQTFKYTYIYQNTRGYFSLSVCYSACEIVNMLIKASLARLEYKAESDLY